MDATVFLPTRRFVTFHQWYRNLLRSGQREDGLRSDSYVVYRLLVAQPGVVWRELQPCLFRGRKRDARRLLYCMFERWMEACARIIAEHNDDNTQNCNEDQACKDHGNVLNLDHQQSALVLLRQRKLRIHLSRKTRQRWKIPSTDQRLSILLWIQPPGVVRVEYLFEGLLIRWEHDLIRAQSLAGYFSTLGGGFFMCHHWRSAVQLAQHQQRMAALLNDWPMYYKCQLNQAYNWIYAGKFKIANKLIDEVQQAAEDWAKRHGGRQLDRSLLPMCSSARLFARRVRKWARTQHDPVSITDGIGAGTQNGKMSNGMVTSTAFSKTMDDFARVRVRRDQSSELDLVKPFS